MKNRNNRPDRSFFFRLLWAFFLTGLVPLFIISLATVISIRRYVDTAYLEGVRKSVNSAAGLTERLISEAGQVTASLAGNGDCVRYLTDGTSRNYVGTGITRECGRIAQSGYYETYIIPADDSVAPVGCLPVPPSYTGRAEKHWGILGCLSRSTGIRICTVAQPHTDKVGGIPLAVGIPVVKGMSVVGYVITDIKREAFSDFLGVSVSRIGPLNDLLITDDTGCIIFSLIGADREGRFLDQINLDTADSISFSKTVDYGITITGTYPKSAKQDFASRIISLTVMLTLISVSCAVIFSLFISRSISSPIIQLTDTMHKIGDGDFSIQCPLPVSGHGFSGRQSDIRFLIERFNYMVTRIDKLMREAVLKQKLLRIAEVQSLQSQINPHFLYNTLSSIRSIAKIQGADSAADMVTILARILREKISNDEDMCSIRESISLAKDYFLIESYRWPGRFTYKEEIETSVAGILIPKLVIQPVVENALIHGLERKQGNGILEIRAAREKTSVVIRVSDNGPGMCQEKIAGLRNRFDACSSGNWQEDVREEAAAGSPVTVPAAHGDSSGIALINTYRRLRLLYGPDAGLRIFSCPGEGTCVEIYFPAGGARV